MPLRWANECGSAEMIKKSTHIWDLIGALKSTSPVSCRNHSYPLILFTQTINQKETHDQDMFNSKKIASYPHGLRTQNPGIREVGLEPRSICWDKENRRQQKRICIMHPRLTLGRLWTHGKNLQDGSPLLSFYWSLRTLFLQHFFNQIPKHKDATLSGHLELENSLTKFIKSMLFSISKLSSYPVPHLTMTGV